MMEGWHEGTLPAAKERQKFLQDLLRLPWGA
jgi:hypothetical protein